MEERNAVWALWSGLGWQDAAQLCGELYYRCWLSSEGLMSVLCLERQVHFQTPPAEAWTERQKDSEKV